MKLPDWLPPLGARDEKLRAAHGLTPKADGWYKSIDGRTRYVAKPMKVAEVVAVLDERIKAIRAKAAGQAAPVVPAKVAPGTMSLEALAETYLAWLYQRVTTGRPKKMARRTYDDNVRTLARFVAVAGPNKQAEAVGPDDFSAYSRKYFVNRAASSIRREITYIEALANWAAPGSRKMGLLARPWFFGPDFNKPDAQQLAEEAGEKDKAYSPAQLRSAFLRVKRMPVSRAAGWLGLNCAFLAMDVATLPEERLDLDAGVIRFPRGKTGVGRLCVLWRPTVLALREYLKVRPEKCEASAKGLVFRTRNGLPYARQDLSPGQKETEAAKAYDGIGNRWIKLCKLPFSGLRATFATAADAWPDQRAVDLVLGHSARGDHAIRTLHYARRFDVGRIESLVNHVYPVVFGRSSISRSPASPAAPSPVPAPRPPGSTASPGA